MAVPSKRFLGVLSVLIGLAVATAAAVGTKPLVNKGESGDLAIKGYDVVAYFGAGVPTKGDPRFVHRWNDATWQFATAKNRNLFANDPEKYAPQFGGYCAWAISHGYTADVDPETFRIVDGKLYLIYSKSVELAVGTGHPWKHRPRPDQLASSSPEVTSLIRAPQLRYVAGQSPDRKVTWLELFFDLVFAAAVAQVASPLREDYSLEGLGRFALLFIMIWWAWTGHAVFSTRFDTDDGVQRGLTLLQMFGVAVMAANARDALDSRSSAGFAAAYAVPAVRAGVSVFSRAPGGGRPPACDTGT